MCLAMKLTRLIPSTSLRRWRPPVACALLATVTIVTPAVLIGTAPVVHAASVQTSVANTTPSVPMDGNVALAWDEPGTPFDSTSVWNTPLPTDTPANPNNSDYLNAIEDNACGETTATPETTPSCTPNINNQVLNITAFSAPLYVVPANYPRVTLTDNCGRRTDFLDTISGGVPVPTDAHGAAGSDHEIQIYQPSTDEYWEFWEFEGSASAGWSACWGGETENVSSSDGVFPNQFGATATSLPLLGSVVRIEELQAGAIDHAIGLVIGDNATANLSSSVDPANVADPNGSQPGVSLPATHGDGGSSDPNAIPEGTRFRLPASLNLNNYDLTPIAKVIAVAAQKYGFIVNDSSPTPTLSMRLGDPTTYTAAGLADPYTSGPGVDGQGTEGLLDGGSQNAIMQNFPWNQLQALPYDYDETPSVAGPCSAPAGGPTGYDMTASDGGIFNYGNLPYCGSTGSIVLNKPVVGIAETPDGGGYWTVASDGGIFAFGDAAFHGSMGGQPLNAPIVGMAVDPATGGYWEVASDGGIFAFDAPFDGSMGGKPLNKPIVGIADDPATGGYWEVASDGGIFAFDASFYGSMGGKPLNKPIVGIADDPATGGYWEVASDGGLFAYDAPFYGSMGGTPLNKPIVGMAATAGGTGYWEVASDGGIFAFNAPFYGSTGGKPLNDPVVAIAGF